MRESSVDWIFKGPACLVLIINLVFLFSIMWVSSLCDFNISTTRIANDYVWSLWWNLKLLVCLFFTRPQVLITKLRSANTAETKQYRKASKALLVLIPLFGLTYLIVLYGPAEGIEKKIFDFARALLLSTQVGKR